jgi:hypothetical protein
MWLIDFSKVTYIKNLEVPLPQEAIPVFLVYAKRIYPPSRACVDEILGYTVSLRSPLNVQCPFSYESLLMRFASFSSVEKPSSLFAGIVCYIRRFHFFKYQVIEMPVA